MTWIVLREGPAGQFLATGETFIGTPEEADAHRVALQAEHGGCYAMRLAP